MMGLEAQAEAVGGAVHALHGIQDVLFLRWQMDNQPRDIQALWAGPDAQEKRDALEERWLVDYNEIIQQFEEHKHANLVKNFHNTMSAFYRPGSVEFLERYGTVDEATNTIRHDTPMGSKAAAFVVSRSSA